MAVAIVQHVRAHDHTATANTIAITVSATGSGNLLVAGVGNQGARTVTGISGGGTWVQFPSTESTGTFNANLKTDFWYVVSSSAGVTSITATYSGAAGTFHKNIEIYEVSGFTTGATDVGAISNNANAGSGSLVGASVTTTSTTGFIVGINQNVAVGTIDQNPATGNEFTSGGDFMDEFGAVSLISSTAAAHQPTWHETNDSDAVASTAAWKEGGSSPQVATVATLGQFSKDIVPHLCNFDTSMSLRYGAYDDDFVTQFSGTAEATATQVYSVPLGVFSKDAINGGFDPGL